MKSGNGRYLVIASGLAIVVTAVIQGVYTALFGVAMSSTVPGMLVSVALFGAVMFGVLAHFNKKISVSVDELISLYDDSCDPQAFVVSGQALADTLSVPYDHRSSWFMSYFAQALLDLGEVQRAQRIEQNMYDSIRQSESVEVQVQIIVNLVPLITKVLGPADAVPVIQKGLELLESQEGMADAPQYEAYLRSQLTIASATVNADNEMLIGYYSASRNNPAIPLRIRVEQAWEEAKIRYRTQDEQLEKECLEFVVEHGCNLALAKPAKERLSSIA